MSTDAASLARDVGHRLAGRHILVGVGGGIAAYKACELVRLLVQCGATVEVAMTPAAREFVGPLTFQALSQRPVATGLLDRGEEQVIGHIALADRADLVILAPATADLLARMRGGQADCIVTAATLAARAPVLVAPAMNVRMWAHPATQENISVLRERNVRVVGPGTGSMACGHVGDGRMSEPADIVVAAARVFAPQDLEGRHILVSAGPTREFLDPVRFISNPSTGKMGYAVAAECAARGSRVTLVSGPVDLPPPAGVDRIDVVTAEQMRDAVLSRLEEIDALVMSAAVGDYRPEIVHAQKQKKGPGPEELRFVRTPDVLLAASERVHAMGRRPVLVGFAAETENVVDHARAKLVGKRLDLVVANSVAQGGAFGADVNSVTLIGPGRTDVLPTAPKAQVARGIVDAVAGLIGEARR